MRGIWERRRRLDALTPERCADAVSFAGWHPICADGRDERRRVR
jgi:hypothetical protein